MTKTLTAEDARQSLTAHVAQKGEEIRAKYGPQIGWNELTRILEDRACVRYPCALRFDAAPLQPGEFAHPVALGARPEDGFTLHVHPFFQHRTDALPFLVLYQLVLVNYGGFAAADDAVAFGAAVLGLPEGDYYDRVCALADELDNGPCSCGRPPADPPP
jgi:hypothetical protein